MILPTAPRALCSVPNCADSTVALKGWADFWKKMHWPLIYFHFQKLPDSWIVTMDIPPIATVLTFAKYCWHVAILWAGKRKEGKKKRKQTTRKACETREKTLQDTGATQEPHLWHLRSASSGVAIEASHSTRPLRCISFFFERILVIWFHLNKKCAGSNPPEQQLSVLHILLLDGTSVRKELVTCPENYWWTASATPQPAK